MSENTDCKCEWLPASVHIFSTSTLSPDSIIDVFEWDIFECRLKK